MAEKQKDAKKFKFRSVKKFFWVGEIGAQFRDGRYETDDEKVAEYLRKLEDVIEEK